MIAFMNGYYEAAQLDIEEMKLLQSDKDSLKKKVMAEGEKYSTLIDIMNPSKNPSKNSSKNSSKSSDYKKYKLHKPSTLPLDVDMYKIEQ